MHKFIDDKHDIDSCMDVWDGLYKSVYPKYFGEWFDFSKIEDDETSFTCKRWYIKLRKDNNIIQTYPKFKMAGDCIFNFNTKKENIFNSYIGNSIKGKELLKKCTNMHHSFENFAFMPITGGMNNQKGRHILDRPDIHIKEIYKYFNNEDSKIFSNARWNKEALTWYLSLFDNDIYKYFSMVYLIDDRDFINNEFLPFADVEINNEITAVQYMELALKFWNKRNIK